MAGTYAVELEDVNKANEVAQAIDARFLNSPNETKTQSEKDFNKGFFAQIGDIGLIVSAIMGAVFFTLLLLTGNTMAQAVRERIPELIPEGVITADTRLVLTNAIYLKAPWRHRMTSGLSWHGSRSGSRLCGISC